jgi:hypothetical protein
VKYLLRAACGLLAVSALSMLLACGAIGGPRAAAYRSQSKNNLRQIALGFMNQHDQELALLPARSVAPDGKPLLSWRVHVLPYMEHRALYEQFHLDEPWDSPHNKSLISQMPEFYRYPGSKLNDGKTTYLALVHDDSAFPADRAKKLTFNDFSDGLAGTILVVEANADRAVEWTRPDDIRFDPNKPLAGLGNAWDDGFQVVSADGAVHFVSRAISPESFKGLVTRGGGEISNWE